MAEDDIGIVTLPPPRQEGAAGLRIGALACEQDGAVDPAVGSARGERGRDEARAFAWASGTPRLAM